MGCRQSDVARQACPLTAVTPLTLCLACETFPANKQGDVSHSSALWHQTLIPKCRFSSGCSYIQELRRGWHGVKDIFPQRTFHTSLSSDCPWEVVSRAIVSWVTCTVPAPWGGTELGGTSLHGTACLCTTLRAPRHSRAAHGTSGRSSQGQSRDSGPGLSPYSTGGFMWHGPSERCFFVRMRNRRSLSP